VWPGRIIVDPPPPDTAAIKTNRMVYLVIWLVFFIVSFITFDMLLDKPLLIVFLVLSSLLISFLFRGNRLLQDALVITEGNIWVLGAVIYHVKTRSVYYQTAYCVPRIEVKQLSFTGKLHTLTLQLSADYTVTISQPVLMNKARYYTKRTIDINEARKMLE
jgi:hypothetical protein